MENDVELAIAVRALVLATEQFRARQARTRLGISPTEMTALGILHIDGPCSINQLARTLAMTSASATELADRMENAGLVRRHAHPTDRRIRLLRPTPTAVRALTAMYAELGDLTAPAAGALPRAALLDFLNSTADTVRTAASTTPDARPAKRTATRRRRNAQPRA